MDKERSSGIRRRLGPIGLSLAAAAVTAIGFAAVSLAQDGGDKGNAGPDTFEAPAPPGGGAGAFFRHDLSDEDRQKMEEFRQCMEDNGAPAPPHLDTNEGPPKPPSSEEIDKVKQAFEACKDKLPEELQRAGFPPHPPCGPPPGAPRGDEGSRDQNEEQGYVVPAPAPSSRGT